MSAQLRPISTIACASALFALGLGVGLPANIAFAVECRTAPNSPAPLNSRWYYRTDRTHERKCWHLQTNNGPLEQGAARAAPIARDTLSKRSQSVGADDSYAGAGFKDSVAQHGPAKASYEDVEKLYAEFLDWKRRPKN